MVWIVYRFAIKKYVFLSDTLTATSSKLSAPNPPPSGPSAAASVDNTENSDEQIR